MLKQTATENRNPNDRMEAIARGVEARLDEKLGYFKTITNETVDIARALGVPDREIAKWVSRRGERLAREEARIKEIKAHLNGRSVKSYA